MAVAISSGCVTSTRIAPGPLETSPIASLPLQMTPRPCQKLSTIGSPNPSRSEGNAVNEARR